MGAGRRAGTVSTMTLSPDAQRGLARWHELIITRNAAGLADLVADDAVFRSPAVFAPQEGRPLVIGYLSAAFAVLGPTLTYHRIWQREDGAALEFTATLDDRQVHGVDLIGFDTEGRIADFTVMVRPKSALDALIAHMVAALNSDSSAT